MSRVRKSPFWIAAAGVAGALAYSRYRRDLALAVGRVSQGSAMAQTACGPVEYASYGDGPAVLLVHGAGGGFDQLLDIAWELAASGFRAITLSRFGYLRTPLAEDASPQAQADAHAALLDALGIAAAAIVGVSAGAPSSLQFALRHARRCRALAILVPLAYAPGRAARPPSGVARFMIEHALKWDFLYWAALNLDPGLVLETILGTPRRVLAGVSARERARAEQMMWNILPLSLRQQGMLNEAAIAASLEPYPLERIAAPTLVVSAADDLYGTYESARYTAERIPGARFVGFESGGHLMAGHGDTLTRELVSFLGEPVKEFAR